MLRSAIVDCLLGSSRNEISFDILTLRNGIEVSAEIIFVLWRSKAVWLSGKFSCASNITGLRFLKTFAAINPAMPAPIIIMSFIKFSWMILIAYYPMK